MIKARLIRGYRLLLPGVLLMSSLGIGESGAASPLKGLELNSTPTQTRILLKTDTAMPYHLVSQSADRIVLDLVTGEPNQSIPTDFAGAGNIDQVILKPVDHRKIRMIIRGKELAPAFVRSYPVLLAQSARNNRIVFEGESMDRTVRPKSLNTLSGASRHPEQGFAMTALENDPTSLPTSPVLSADTPQGETTGISNASAATEPSEGLLPQKTLDTTAETGSLFSQDPSIRSDNVAAEDAPAASTIFDGPAPDRQPMARGADFSQSADLETETPSWQDTAWENLTVFGGFLRQQAGQGHLGGALKLVILGGLLLLVGFLIRRKWARDPFDFTSDAPVEASQKLFSDKPRRNRRRGRRRDVFQAASNPPAGRSEPRSGGSSERPIGLSSLNQDPPHDLPLSPAIPSRIAADQYARQAASPVPDGAFRDHSAIDRELQQSIALRTGIQTTHSRRQLAAAAGHAKSPAKPSPKTPTGLVATNPTLKPPSVKTPNKAGASKPAKTTALTQTPPGLPGNNTEVLDFLRSVAELMEQDGKADLAKGLKNTIPPKRPI